MEGMSARVYDPDQQETNSSLGLTGGKQWECNRSSGSSPGVWYLVLTGTKSNYTIDTWTMPPYVDPIPKISIKTPANNSAVQSLLVDVSGNASDDKSVASVYVFPDGVPPQNWTKATGTTSWTATVNISEQAAHGGSIKLWALVTDSDGNQNNTTVTVLYNNHIPRVFITSPLNNSVAESLLVEVRGTASDDKSVEKVDVAAEGVGPAFWTRATGTTKWNATLDLSGHLDQNGSATVWAYVTDDDGNINSTSIRVICNAAPPDDTTPPTISITSPTEGQILNDNNVTVEGTADDDVGVRTISLRVNQTNWRNVSRAPGTGTRVLWNLSLSLPSGYYLFMALATDNAGNTCQTSVNVTVEGPGSDLTPPTLVITYPQPESRHTNASITVRGTAHDNAGIAKVEVVDSRYYSDPQSWRTASTSDGWSNWSIEWPMGMGVNYIHARATDINGLKFGREVMVYRDEHQTRYPPPVVRITSPSDGTVVKDRRLEIRCSVVGNASLEQEVLRVNGVPVDSKPFYGGVRSMNWSFNVTLKTGTNIVNLTVTDISGNTASDQIKVIRSGETPQPFPGFEGPLLFAGLAIAAVMLSRKKKP